METTKDYTFNKAHAQELVENLRDYWKMRGFTKYKFWLKPVKIITPTGSTMFRYEIDSNLIVRAPRLEEI